jgi:hypothetical protein
MAKNVFSVMMLFAWLDDALNFCGRIDLLTSRRLLNRYLETAHGNL